MRFCSIFSISRIKIVSKHNYYRSKFAFLMIFSAYIQPAPGIQIYEIIILGLSQHKDSIDSFVLCACATILISSNSESISTKLTFITLESS